MREYELRRGVAKTLEGDGLRAIAQRTFSDVAMDGGRITVSFGAIERMTAWTDGKKLFVDTVMRKDVPDHVATETIKAFNAFLETATGYTAKERSKKAQEAAKKGTT